VLLLLELRFGGSADFDYRYAACEFREALLELFAVIIGIGVVDFATNLINAALDLASVAATLNYRRLVLAYLDRFRGAKLFQIDVLQFCAGLPLR
jgi:hypothetical protein